MHSLAPYTIRTYDQQYFRLHNTYPPLDKVLGRLDLYEIFKDSFTEQGIDFHIVEDEKKIYRIVNLQVDDKARIIKGFLQQGSYGLKSDIINIDTGNIDYAKTEKNAELINYYFYLKLPLTYNEGFAFFQSYKSVSAKTIIFNILNKYYKEKSGLVLQFKPLTDDKSFDEWKKKAQVKEIKLTKFTGIDDKAQRISNLGHRENIETVLIVKPKKGNFGLLKNFLTQDTDQFKAVEVWEEECQQVKTVVSLNGKNRTFTVGRNQTTALCEIEAPDYIEVQGGLPTPESLNRWFEEIDQEFTRSLYKP
ncbi:hypothetical protein A7P53_15915 [Acinetobacter defluvii]|uniref:hypothetical protein n=1 Tax=Acinetobacter defluvii TaxID=1871111 RepID=UPI0014901F7E|nr:hypothetical protein [Acinetobacter defluvii]NNP74140.1 hypothetical protein [Acinetobacter defluvii]